MNCVVIHLEKSGKDKGCQYKEWSIDGEVRSSSIDGTNTWFWLRNVFAEDSLEVNHSPALIFRSVWLKIGYIIRHKYLILFHIFMFIQMFTHHFENNSWNWSQWILEFKGLLSLSLQELAAFCRVGTLSNVFPVVDMVLGSTSSSGVNIVWEVLSSSHQTSNEINSQGSLCELILVRIGLNMFQGTSMNFIAIALILSMVASKSNIASTGFKLKV